MAIGCGVLSSSLLALAAVSWLGCRPVAADFKCGRGGGFFLEFGSNSHDAQTGYACRSEVAVLNNLPNVVADLRATVNSKASTRTTDSLATRLAEKANTTDLNTKADNSTMHAELAKKASKTDLNTKADNSTMHAELAKKDAKIISLETKLEASERQVTALNATIALQFQAMHEEIQLLSILQANATEANEVAFASKAADDKKMSTNGAGTIGIVFGVLGCILGGIAIAVACRGQVDDTGPRRISAATRARPPAARRSSYSSQEQQSNGLVNPIMNPTYEGGAGNAAINLTNDAVYYSEPNSAQPALYDEGKRNTRETAERPADIYESDGGSDGDYEDLDI
jgi:hypothetical protein